MHVEHAAQSTDRFVDVQPHAKTLILPESARSPMTVAVAKVALALIRSSRLTSSSACSSGTEKRCVQLSELRARSDSCGNRRRYFLFRFRQEIRYAAAFSEGKAMRRQPAASDAAGGG